MKVKDVLKHTIETTPDQFMKYVISGVTVATFNLFLLFVFTEWFGLWYIASIAVSFPLVFVLSFLLQKFWTFQNKDVLMVKRQIILYFFIAIFGFVINIWGVYFLVEYLSVWYMLAQFLVLGFIAVVSFILYKFVVFK